MAGKSSGRGSNPTPSDALPAAHPLRDGIAQRSAGDHADPGSRAKSHVSAPREERVTVSPPRLRDRYELGAIVAQQHDVVRFQAWDHQDGAAPPKPVIVVRGTLRKPDMQMPSTKEIHLPAEKANADDEWSVFDFSLAEEAAVRTEAADSGRATAPWPSPAWEGSVLANAQHPALPRVLERFADDRYEYLVLEQLTGVPIAAAWSTPGATVDQQYGWLRQLAEALEILHRAGAVAAGLRPEVVAISASGQPVLTDLADLLPLPIMGTSPRQFSLYTAPELRIAEELADSRVDLYSFGGLLFALLAGRELSDQDFEGPGEPTPFLVRYPEAHPLLARLLGRTFCRNPRQRFPSADAARDDPTGFLDLAQTLEMCRRSLDRVRLDVAAWTSTGFVRSGNQDAFAIMHETDAADDEFAERAVVIVVDGLGGHEGGELAAALAIATMRTALLDSGLFRRASNAAPLEANACKEAVAAAVREANRRIYEAAQLPEQGKPGMGCTADLVYIDGPRVFVGHVGDSRTFHLRDGKLMQLTRDQTLVERMVELGQLTPEEARQHPRRSELLQALGGQADVVPEICQTALKPGDWLVVCSDGLTLHVGPEALTTLLATASSAETAARRLVNLANLEGGADNITVAVVRAI